MAQPEAVTDGRVVRGDRTRRAILDRAVEIASVEGLEGLSIGRLATELRASKSGVFAHFGSKEDLQLAVIDAAAQMYIDQIVQPAVRTPPGLRRLWRLCDLWLDFLRRRSLPGVCFFLAVSTEFDARPGRVRDELARLRSEWARLYRRAIDEAKRAGELDRADSAQLYFEIEAFVTQAVLDTQLLDDAAAFRRARTAIVSRLRAAAADPSQLPSR